MSNQSDGDRSLAARRLAFYDALTTDPGVSHLDCRVAWRLLHYFNAKHGYAWPSLARLATEIHAAKRSVIRSVTRLEADGWFAVKRDERPGRGLSNHYTPLWKRVTEENPLEPPSNGKGAAATAEKGDSNDIKRVSEEHP